MKKIFFLSVMIILLRINIFAQSSNSSMKHVKSHQTYALNLNLTNLKNFNEVTTWLYDVSFTNSNNGTVVGTNGLILRTTDGGITWKQQASGTTSDLFGVCFTDSSDGTVVGMDGIILRTRNAGDTWIQQSSGVTNGDLYDVAFADENYGIAVGSTTRADFGLIDITNNGGSTWTLQTVSTPLSSVSYINKHNATAVGWDGKIFRTSNSGITWTVQSKGSNYDLNGICLADINNGIIVGTNGIILNTTDGGTTWNQQSSGTTTHLHGVSFSDANNGVAVGDGIILRTTNGGLNWAPQSSGTIYPLFAVCCIDNDNSTAVGYNGMILKTTNGGTKWFPQSGSAPFLEYPQNNSSDVHVNTEFVWEYVVIPDFAQLQISIDSLFSIIYMDTVITDTKIDISYLPDSTLFYWRVRGYFQNRYGNWTDIWSFITMGKTSRLVNPVNNSIISPKSVSFQWSESAYTSEYRLQISTDSLFLFNVIENDTITGCSFITNLNYDTKYYWRIGSKNVNGQTYWSDQWTFYSTRSPKTSFPLDIGNIWYYKGTITTYNWVSTDAKKNYYGIKKQIIDSMSNGFKNITSTYYYLDHTMTKFEYWGYIDGRFYVTDTPAIDNNHLYYDDYLEKTDTCIINYRYGGTCRNFIITKIFGEFETGQTYELYIYQIQYRYKDYATLLGNIGIVKTIKSEYAKYQTNWVDTTELIGMLKNGIVFGDTVFSILTGTDENYDVTLNYALLQNYPNPFNPTTNISFTLQHDAIVSLKVFDLLGREVATLVQEKLQTGNYVLQWNAAKMSSGIYFYRLQADSFTETKKLLLLK